MRYMKGLLQIAIAVDQLINTLPNLVGAGGWADETISSRLYRLNRDGRKLGFVMYLVDALFLVLTFKVGHCKDSYYSELGRKHLPEDFI